MVDKVLNINSDEFVKLTNKLEKIGRADLPVAIRSTLNNLAFDMKGGGGKRGMIDRSAEKDFDYRRNKTLFRAMTGVTKARGLEIKSMQSEAGIVSRAGRTQLAKGLAQQQQGGNIKQKATPLSGARTGQNIGKKVRKQSYLRKLNAIDLRNVKKGAFHARAITSYKAKRTVLIDGRGGNTLIARIRSFRRMKSSIKYRIKWLYRINESGNVSLEKKRPFINHAANRTMKTMPNEFVKQANKRITKALNK